MCKLWLNFVIPRPGCERFSSFAPSDFRSLGAKSRSEAEPVAARKGAQKIFQTSLKPGTIHEVVIGNAVNLPVNQFL